MRITTGKFRNKKIFSMADKEGGYRPSMEKVRLALVNMMMHSKFVPQNFIEGAVIADICCGSGAFGFEMLSNGAKKVFFIDKAYSSMQLVRKTAQSIGIDESQAITMQSDAGIKLQLQEKINIAFIDPPYKSDIHTGIMSNLRHVLAEEHIVIMECDARANLLVPDVFSVVCDRLYSKTKIVFFRLNSIINSDV